MRKRLFSFVVFLLVVFLVTGTSIAPKKPRARDLGIPFDGTPGPLNAITDVTGVEVGQTTLIRGEGQLKIGEGPVRTGVTAILPRGKENFQPVFAGWFSLNGDGEMTGTTWVEDSGLLRGPVMITNTLSVGMVHHSVIAWGVERGGRGFQSYDFLASLPVVAETWDGTLNDIWGQHVKKEHVYQALNSAASGPVSEGCTGGGTGMICHGFKGGTGTSSRTVSLYSTTYTVGVLVQANYGEMEQLRIAGVPAGREIAALWKKETQGRSSVSDIRQYQGWENKESGDFGDEEADSGRLNKGSIIIVIATDAPALPHQLKRLARRASLGLARNGSVSGNSSGDIFIAFSTANQGADKGGGLYTATVLNNSQFGLLFEPTVQATEEAIINALVAAETMTGVNGRTVRALPHGLVKEILKKYNRLQE